MIKVKTTRRIVFSLFIKQVDGGLVSNQHQISCISLALMVNRFSLTPGERIKWPLGRKLYDDSSDEVSSFV